MNIKLDYFYFSAYDLEIKGTKIVNVEPIFFSGETLSGVMGKFVMGKYSSRKLF